MRGDAVWRVETYGASSTPPSEAQLAAAAALEAACFPERGGGTAAALAELRRATQLRRAALLLCTSPETDAHAACDDDAPLLGYALVTWTVGAGSVVKARKACAVRHTVCTCNTALTWRVGPQLAVATHARRTGIGAALLSAALAQLRAAGAAAVTLHVDAGPGGAPARRLYAHFGFAEDSRAAAYYGAGRDALRMSAPL